VTGPGLNSENLVFRLRPDARIAGTILDEESEPVPGAAIYLFRTDAASGLRRTSLVTQAMSDDRGYYRFAHLEPGWYFLVVSAQPWFSQLARQQDNEDDHVTATNAGLNLAFPTTFYPGVTDPADASQIVLNDGEDFTADFNLPAVPAVRLRIHHVNADPEDPRGVSLKQKLFGILIDPPSQRQSTVEDSVEIEGVPLGKYLLQVQSYGPTAAARSTVIDLSADSDLTADDGSTVPLICGVVQMEGGLDLRPQAFVRLWHTGTDDVLDTQVAGNGEFSFTPEFLTPGNYSLFVMNGENSIIGTLSATGAKVDGQTIQITGSRPVKLNITLPKNLSTVNGTARRDGQPFPGAMIVLVPENPQINLPLFRRDESDSDGTFTLHDVLPGRYRILAIENGWDLEWANPALLASRLEHAQPLEIQLTKTYQTVVNVN